MPARFGAAGEDDGACVEQAFGNQPAHHGGLVADAGERARLLVVGGDQAQREIVASGSHQVADFAGEQRFAADKGDLRFIHLDSYPRKVAAPPTSDFWLLTPDSQILKGSKGEALAS